MKLKRPIRYKENISQARLIEEQCFFNANNKRCVMVKCSKCQLSDKYYEITGLRLEELEPEF